MYTYPYFETSFASCSCPRCWRQASAEVSGTEASTLYLPSVGKLVVTDSMGLVCPSEM